VNGLAGPRVDEPASDRIPVLDAVKQDDRPLVAAVGKRADHAHHWRHADAASDQHMRVRWVAYRERAVRSIKIDTFSGWDLVNLASCSFLFRIARPTVAICSHHVLARAYW
jgi:hypothetical protein